MPTITTNPGPSPASSPSQHLDHRPQRRHGGRHRRARRSRTAQVHAWVRGARSGRVGVLVLGAMMALATAIAAPGAAQAAHAASAAAPSCSSRFFSVEMGLINLRVHGTLCLPAGGHPTTVQVLEPGATYDSAYWAGPPGDTSVSYVDQAVAGGWATLDLDRVGTGQSDKPLSALVTGTAEAQVLHQVIGQVRAGLPGAPAFQHVVLAGHSLGSLISVIEVGTWHDVDGLILTGWSTSIQAPELLRLLVGGLIPAPLDPSLGTVDPGYLTTAPGSRAGFFYTPADSTPSVVAWDEQTKSVVSAAEVTDSLLLGQSTALTRSITVPVLVANGSQDSIFCGGGVDCSSDAALADSEASAFAPAAHLAATVLPGAGHDNALAANAETMDAAVAAWLRSAGLR